MRQSLSFRKQGLGDRRASFKNGDGARPFASDEFDKEKDAAILFDRYVQTLPADERDLAVCVPLYKDWLRSRFQPQHQQLPLFATNATPSASVRGAPSELTTPQPRGGGGVIVSAGEMHFVPVPAKLSAAEKALANRMWNRHAPSGSDWIDDSATIAEILTALHVPEVDFLQRGGFLEAIMRAAPSHRICQLQFTEILTQCKALHSVRRHRQEYEKKREWLIRNIERHREHRRRSSVAAGAPLPARSAAFDRVMFGEGGAEGARKQSTVEMSRGSSVVALGGDSGDALPTEEALYAAFCAMAEMAGERRHAGDEEEPYSSSGGEDGNTSDSATTVRAGRVVEFLVNFDLAPADRLNAAAPRALGMALERREAAREEDRRSMRQRKLGTGMLDFIEASPVLREDELPVGALRPSGTTNVFSETSLGSPTVEEDRAFVKSVDDVSLSTTQQSTDGAPLTFEEFKDYVLSGVESSDVVDSRKTKSKRTRLVRTRLKSFGLVLNASGGGVGAGPSKNDPGAAALAVQQSHTGLVRKRDQPNTDPLSLLGRSQRGALESSDVLPTPSESDADETADVLDSAVQDILRQYRAAEEAERVAEMQSASGGTGGGRRRQSNKSSRTLAKEKIAEREKGAKKPLRPIVGPAGFTHYPSIATTTEKKCRFSTHRVLPPTEQAICDGIAKRKEEGTFNKRPVSSLGLRVSENDPEAAFNIRQGRSARAQTPAAFRAQQSEETNKRARANAAEMMKLSTQLLGQLENSRLKHTAMSVHATASPSPAPPSASFEVSRRLSLSRIAPAASESSTTPARTPQSGKNPSTAPSPLFTMVKAPSMSALRNTARSQKDEGRGVSFPGMAL